MVKGIVEDSENAENAAAREFAEETGWEPPPRPWISLGETKLKSRKVVVAWAAEANYEPKQLEPGMFRMGNRLYPEIDRVAWLTPDEAHIKLNSAQVVFVNRLIDHLGL